MSLCTISPARSFSAASTPLGDAARNRGTALGVWTDGAERVAGLVGAGASGPGDTARGAAGAAGLVGGGAVGLGETVGGAAGAVRLVTGAAAGLGETAGLTEKAPPGPTGAASGLAGPAGAGLCSGAWAVGGGACGTGARQTDQPFITDRKTLSPCAVSGNAS